MIYYCDNKRHLVCVPYSVENLHQMAEDLNIKRCWFHAGDKPHYDIPKRRMDEIKARCVVYQYIEIKGYKTKLDVCKWEQFQHPTTSLG